jgi:hypothetical protein
VPYPYADDPRLDAAHALIAQARAAGAGTAGLGTQLARQLGIAERTGQRLIKAALGHGDVPAAAGERHLAGPYGNPDAVTHPIPRG